jgi:hypothetical protein
MRMMCHGPGVQVVAVVPCAGPCSPAEHGCEAGGKRFLDLLRADEMDVGVDAAGCQDLALAGDRFRAWPDDDVDAGLHIRVSGLADTNNATVLQAHIRLHDPPPIDDQRVGNDRINRTFGPAALGLAHAIADHLAAAKLHLLAVGREVLLDLDDQIGVGKPHTIPGGWPEHAGIGVARDTIGHGRPLSGGNG